MHRRTVFIAIAFAPILTGCNLFQPPVQTPGPRNDDADTERHETGASDTSALDTTPDLDASDAEGVTDSVADSRETSPRDTESPSDDGTDTTPPETSDGGETDTSLPPTLCNGRVQGAAFCDGFESKGLLAWANSVEQAGKVERTTSRAKFGVASAHAKTTAPDGYASFLSKKFGPIQSGSLWMRGWFWVPSGLQVDSVAMLFVRQSGAPYEGIGFGVLSKNKPFAHVGAQNADVISMHVPMPRDQWVCAEVHFELQNSGARVKVWIDGTLAAKRTGLETRPSSGLTTVAAGLTSTSKNQQGAEVWVDEVALDNNPIGCGP